jgi:hypothetical protein
LFLFSIRRYSIMLRRFTALVLGAVVGSAAILPAADDQKPQIKGGIEGKVKKVDVDAKTLTITTLQGRERTCDGRHQDRRRRDVFIFGPAESPAGPSSLAAYQTCWA